MLHLTRRYNLGIVGKTASLSMLESKRMFFAILQAISDILFYSEYCFHTREKKINALKYS